MPPKSKQPDSYITLNESFNQSKLHYIIENRELYQSKMRVYDDDYDPFATALKYLKKSKNGQLQATYKQNAGFGRFCAVGSLSLQCIPREIRHTIAKEYYIDIDIKNCHPIILEHLCKSRNIACKSLSNYNSHRDEYLKEIGDKKIILSLLNGGTKLYKQLQSKPDWIVKLKNEIKDIHNQFAKDSEFKKHRKDREKANITYNHEASYISTLLCDFENKILQVIYKSIGSPKNAVLCFDGIMIQKDSSIDLESLQNTVLSTLGIKIELVQKPMDQGFELPEDIPEYTDQNNNRFDFTDPYTYNKFRNEFNDHLFSSYDELDDALSDKYKRVIAHITKGAGCFIKKLDNNRFDITTMLKSSNFTMTVLENDKKIKIKFEDYLCKQQSFADIVCDLDIENCASDKFNIWSGFQAKRVDVPESDGLKLMKSFIFDTWANGNIEYYNYIVSWLAGLVTNLKGINKVALAMVSGQGTGKNTLFDFMGYILGTTNTASVAGINSITGSFNSILQNKRLININEMSSTKDEFRSNFDKIKGYITDSTIQITPKGVDTYTISNIGNYVLFTNHRDSIIVEQTDRRYAIFEMSSVYANNSEYFDRLYKLCFNQDVANEFYTYLLDFDSVDLSKIPMTELKLEMMYLSTPAPLRFLEEYSSSYDESCDVKAMELYNEYRRWCEDNGERTILTNTKFGTVITTKLKKIKKRDGWYYQLIPLL